MPRRDVKSNQDARDGARNPLVDLGRWMLPAMLAVVIILPFRSAVADWNE